MNKKVLLLAGWGGSDYPHWQSWLASEIVKDYGTVNFLKFENFDFPNKILWKQQLIKEIEEFKPDIVICHSIACILWFHLCNEYKMSDIDKLILVAPPSLSCDIEELSSFYPCEVPDSLNSTKSLLVSSDNDPYMKMDEINSLQKKLNIPLKILENAGHINSDSGFGEWLWILKEIKNENR